MKNYIGFYIGFGVMFGMTIISDKYNYNKLKKDFKNKIKN